MAPLRGSKIRLANARGGSPTTTNLREPRSFLRSPIHQSQLLVVEFATPLNRLSDVAGGGYLPIRGIGVGGADVAGGAEYFAHVFGEVEAIGVPGAVFIRLRDEEIIRALISGQEKNIALISKQCYLNLEL